MLRSSIWTGPGVSKGHYRSSKRMAGIYKARWHDNKVLLRKPGLQSEVLRTLSFLSPCEQQAPLSVKIVMWGTCAWSEFAVSILWLAGCICYRQRLIQLLISPITGLACTMFSDPCEHVVILSPCERRVPLKKGKPFSISGDQFPGRNCLQCQ